LLALANPTWISYLSHGAGTVGWEPRFGFRVDKSNEFARLGLGLPILAGSHQRRNTLARPPFDNLGPPETAAERRARVFKEGTKTLSEYQEAAVNIRKNMARLRELRLAKEAADRATGSTAAKATSKELPTKGTKAR
jgi:hypothetical protein